MKRHFPTSVFFKNSSRTFFILFRKGRCWPHFVYSGGGWVSCRDSLLDPLAAGLVYIKEESHEKKGITTSVKTCVTGNKSNKHYSSFIPCLSPAISCAGDADSYRETVMEVFPVFAVLLGLGASRCNFSKRNFSGFGLSEWGRQIQFQISNQASHSTLQNMVSNRILSNARALLSQAEEVFSEELRVLKITSLFHYVFSLSLLLLMLVLAPISYCSVTEMLLYSSSELYTDRSDCVFLFFMLALILFTDISNYA